MTLTPKVRQIAFGVYVAIRNSGDAYAPWQDDATLDFVIS